MEPKNRDVDVYCNKILHKLISQYTNMKEYHLNMCYRHKVTQIEFKQQFHAPHSTAHTEQLIVNH